ncbi:unnamed protein product [Linum trigynum]|uniref:Bifunctional inhibitor/plant lipid transfer protein/seed storage helical domain-containing protein n=1 Tax=Linum trigynum TaxID=586398 RepID=A0AAV2DLX4_9ROSI
MAKLSLAVAAFLLFLVATEATIRTTVIVDEDVDASNQRGGGCSQEMQRFDNLRNCQEYMMEMMREQRGGRGVEMVVAAAANPMMKEQCCQDLRQMESQCTCQGLEMAMNEMMRKMAGQMEQQEMQTMWRMAENLPGKCDASPSSCQFRGGRQQIPAWF